MSMPRIVSTRWDGNGSFHVEVAGSWPRTERAERAARRVARKADPMRKTQWTRLDHVRLADGELVYSFTVSRLSRDYYSRPGRA